MRGQGDNLGSVTRSSSGEIPFLDADNIEDYAGMEASYEETNYGSIDETKAIKNVIAKLGKTSIGQKLSSEQLEEKAIDLYNKICLKTVNGTEKDLEEAAQLFGEDKEDLRLRLQETFS